MLSPSGFKYSTVSTGTVYTTNLQENSFYGNPVTDGQDWKARIMLDRPIDIYIASEVACRKRARTAKASQRYRQRRWEEMKQKDIKETMKQHNKMPQT
jgi:cytidylate kinase